MGIIIELAFTNSMSSGNPTTSYQDAPSAVSRESILRVWDIVNRHFQSLLGTAERSATQSRAEINIQNQVNEVRDIMRACSERLQSIESYISELQKQNKSAMNTNNCSYGQTPYSELGGEWHFLYMEDNSVFGYMKLVPETVSVTSKDAHGKGSTSVKRAEFTIPLGVMTEVNESLDDDGDDDGDYSNRLDKGFNYAQCPCCQISFKSSRFWKHALFEIAERGNRVPAWQSLDRSETPRWIVEGSAGWNNPIYRPRCLENTCEIGQSLAELNLKHFLSDYEFSRALDSTFECLALHLRN